MRRLLTISFTRSSIETLIEHLEDRKRWAEVIKSILLAQRDQCFSDALKEADPGHSVYDDVDMAVKHYVNENLNYVFFKRYNLFYNTYMKIIDVIMGVFDKLGLNPQRRNNFDVKINVDHPHHRADDELYRGEASFNQLSIEKGEDITTGKVYWIVNLSQYGSHLQEVLKDTNNIEDRLDSMIVMLDLFIEHAINAKVLLGKSKEDQEIHFPVEPLNRCLNGIIELRDELIKGGGHS